MRGINVCGIWENAKNDTTSKRNYLEATSRGVCSVSFLSKFERGDSDITLGLMTKLLEKLMMNFDEFLFIHHDYQPDQLEQFFNAARTAYFNRDVHQLKQLKNTALNKWRQYGVETYHFNALLLAIYESIVDSKYIDEGEWHMIFRFFLITYFG